MWFELCGYLDSDRLALPASPVAEPSLSLATEHAHGDIADAFIHRLLGADWRHFALILLAVEGLLARLDKSHLLKRDALVRYLNMSNKRQGEFGRFRDTRPDF